MQWVNSSAKLTFSAYASRFHHQRRCRRLSVLRAWPRQENPLLSDAGRPGANHGRDIVRMVVGDGLRPVVSGIVAGLLIGGVVRMMLTPLFVRLLPAVDPFVLTIVPLLMVLAAGVACYLTARRAARVDPNTALRES